jgi:hypothetical protein
VNPPPPLGAARTGARRPASPLGAVARPLLIALIATALVAGVLGGMLRGGAVLPTAGQGVWLAHAALFHAALMVGGLMGTVIGIERAVAIRSRWAFAAPLASGAAAVLLLIGWFAAGAWLLVAAAVVFCGASMVVVRRQAAEHTRLLLLAALSWLAGNVSFALGASATLAWWFVFLVLTIAAERLEMTRLMPRRPSAQRAFHAIVVALLLGAALSAAAPRVGGVLYGASLTALAAWLARYDIARRTVAARGLSRYMAVCLLAGYAWLAVAGVAWAATALGAPARDAALHGIGLGFVFSMVMGHAPVILPAVSRIKLRFGTFFYVPLAALHASLVVRLGFGLVDPALRTLGVALNAVALALFVATMLVSALIQRTTPSRSPGTIDRNP